jgi:O-acetyl-ADP-ribose deacetylase (regulator of RNase III)
MGYVSKWGELDMKGGMLFPLNVVDGLVHELGGLQLAFHCLLLPKKKSQQEAGGDDRCPVGCAVSTPPGGTRLAAEYNRIVHTVPPFYEHYDGDPNEALSNCYRNALTLCEQSLRDGYSSLRIASPLLGAGGRGFPLQEAVAIAAKESLRWRDATHEDTDDTKERVLSFGIPQMDVATRFIEMLKHLDDNYNE